MDVIRISPRGYCYGVVDAMNIARNAAHDASLPRPIYIIGLIVHNQFAVDELTSLGVTTQTTLSQWDTARLTEELVRRFPQAEVYNEICMATQLRQEAVAAQARGADLTIVVGDPRSNNTNRLAQVAEELASSPSIRIESVDDLTPEMIAGKRRIAITAGASTPSQITRAVLRYVESFGARTKLTPTPER
jgi:4-hydroxy-3-methylbut-2-en-1-yl diphosphate reductase